MDQINLLLSSLPDGILLGFVYGLAAMGLTLIWGVMNVINLAHGPIIALGMFGTFFLYSRLGINPYVGLVPVAIVGLLFGVLIYAVAVHRVINAPHLSSLLATFSVNMIIIGLGTAALTTSPYNVDFTAGSISIGSTTLLGTRLIAALDGLFAKQEDILWFTTKVELRSVDGTKASIRFVCPTLDLFSTRIGDHLFHFG